MKNGPEQRGPVQYGPRQRGRESNGRRLLIVGAGGMLGTALTRVARLRGYDALPYAEAELDITDREATRKVLAEFSAGATASGATGAVVNAAAYTDVERAEDDAARAYLINERAAGSLAAAAHEVGLPLVHVSTDFVFDGAKNGDYVETDEPHPLSVYGASKLAGERAVVASHPAALLVRTAWTYGPSGTNFPVKILARARGAAGAKPVVLRVVDDEIGSPTYSVDLAAGLLELLEAGANGLFHLAGGGCCSRHELAVETLRLAGVSMPDEVVVEPVCSATFPTKAERPKRAVLDCSKAASWGVCLPAWQDGLARYLAEF